MIIAHQGTLSRDATRTAGQTTTLLGAGAVLAEDRLGGGSSGRRRPVARRDEDVITLAAEAARQALPAALRGVSALILASTTGPYQEGGSSQTLAEILGLQGDVLAIDLTASRRDGLLAIRL